MKENKKERVLSAAGRLLHQPEVSILAPLLVLCAVAAVLNPNFLSRSNVADTLNYISLDFIIAIGMTFTIISGGMDLSVGSVVALSGYSTGLALVNGVPVVLAVMLGLAVGSRDRFYKWPYHRFIRYSALHHYAGHDVYGEGCCERIERRPPWRIHFRTLSTHWRKHGFLASQRLSS